jgi:hypothetical protein
LVDVDVSAAGKGQEWTARLFKMIDTYEETPTAFDGEGFMELYAKVERAIELSGESESQAFGLDQALFTAVSISDVDSSDLRLVVSHALTIHHRYHADYGRGFEQAYRWCERSRGKQMPDLRYVHTFLLPLLVKKGAMGGRLDVCLFLLERLGRFENLEKSPVWDDEQAVELVRQEPGEIVYQLARRRVKYIAENLTKGPNSLEQRLHKDGVFKQLLKDHEESAPILAHEIRVYEYTRRDPLLRRLAIAFTGLFRGLVQRMAGEYIAYEMTKRNGAFIVQGALIVVILLGLLMGCYAWVLRSNSRLDEIERDLGVTKELIDKDAAFLSDSADSLRASVGRW